MGDMNIEKYWNKTLQKVSESFKQMKGGIEDKMEIKSRYEVMSELEEKKRRLILARDGLKEELRLKKKDLRDSEREIEDTKEDIKAFEDSIKEKETTSNELIKSIDDSLKRLSDIKK